MLVKSTHHSIEHLFRQTQYGISSLFDVMLRSFSLYIYVLHIPISIQKKVYHIFFLDSSSSSSSFLTELISRKRKCHLFSFSVSLLTKQLNRRIMLFFHFDSFRLF